MNASISNFYSVTPNEKIISTIDNDLNMIDNVLPGSQSKLLSFAMKSQVKLAVSAYSVLYILAVIPLVGPVSVYYLRKFIRALVQSSKVEEAADKDQMYHLKESIEG